MIKEKASNVEIWIGLIKVEQKDRTGPLGDADGAYTNAVGLASSKLRFRRLVERRLRAMDLTLLRLEAAEPLAVRTAKHAVHKDIRKLVADLDSVNPIAFDVFATFDED